MAGTLAWYPHLGQELNQQKKKEKKKEGGTEGLAIEERPVLHYITFFLAGTYHISLRNPA